jgi:hypothetical protein
MISEGRFLRCGILGKKNNKKIEEQMRGIWDL